jgi:hypothetical protein
VLLEQFAHVLVTIEGVGARYSVPRDVHADDVQHLTLVLDVKLRAYESKKAHSPCGVIARVMDVVNIERDHGEDPPP